MIEEIKMTDEIRAEVITLATALREGVIEDMDVARLDQLLADCPGAVDVFVELALLAIDLKDLDGQGDVPVPVLAALEPPQPKRMRYWILAAAAAAVLIVGLLSTNGNSGPTVLPPERGAVVAKASSVYNAVFAYGGVDGALIASGAPMHAGTYHLDSGILEMTYGNGAEVIIEAPAEFTLANDMLLLLASGDLSARVPEAAIGFTVETEAAKVVDLGTEFSIRATAESSEVHVFEGEVVVESNSAKESEPLHLFKDQASRITVVGGTPMGIDVKPDEFLRDLQEPRHTYPRAISQLKPVVFYRMRPHEANVLDDFGPQKINGAFIPGSGRKSLWAPGRCGASLRAQGPGKGGHAIVEDLAVSETGAFSVVAWVLAESRPQAATIVNHWGGGRSGLFRLGLSRLTGGLESTVRNVGGEHVVIATEEPFPLGEWQQVVLTSDAQTVRIYQNGEEIASTAYDGIGAESKNARLTIGAKVNPRTDGIRVTKSWDGRIDEVAIFDRALTPQEILELYSILPVQ